MFRSLESLLHTLHLYGAAGIAAFGWALCTLLGWEAAPWLPLWFCSARLIYNLDRLRRDPADLLNLPARAAACVRWRAASLGVVLIAGAVLVAVPVARRDWLTLELVVGGAFVSVQYSVPLLGFRLKDVPLLKSFVAPTVIVGAIFGLPWLHAGPRPGAVLAAVWAWGYLEFNMILCDLRDLEGDRRCGVTSLPVRLGADGTRRVLRWLIVATSVLAAAEMWGTWARQVYMPWVQSEALARTSLARGLCAFVLPAYPLHLLQASYYPRSERHYEWLVEGMLFLPALVVGAVG